MNRTITCKNCEIEFQYGGSRKRIYCSKNCYGISLKGKTHVERYGIERSNRWSNNQKLINLQINKIK